MEKQESNPISKLFYLGVFVVVFALILVLFGFVYFYFALLPFPETIKIMTGIVLVVSPLIGLLVINTLLIIILLQSKLE